MFASKDLIGKFKASKPKLLYTQLEEDKIALIKQYKQDLLGIRRDTFREASDCLLELYVLTDLLDKAIRNIDRSDVSFVLSAVRCVARDGKSLLEHHAKEHYLDSIIAAGRSSHKDSVQIEEKIDVFRKVYDKMQQHIQSLMLKYPAETLAWNSTHPVPCQTPEQSYRSAEAFLQTRYQAMLLQKGIKR